MLKLCKIKPIFPPFYMHFVIFSVISLVFELITSFLTADLKIMIYSFIWYQI